MRVRLRRPALIALLLLASSFEPAAFAQAQGPAAAAPPVSAAPSSPAPGSVPKPRPHPAAPAAATQRPPAAEAASPTAPAHTFDFANVRHLAQQRAAHDYRPMSQALPASLANLS